MKAFCLAALLLLGGAQSAPRSAPRAPASAAQQSTASPEMNFFSPKQDIEIGDDSSADAQKQLPVVRDAALNQYLRSLGSRLLRGLPPSQLRYRFQIVNSMEVSSLGFPNGAIFVYRGLLELAANDAEVAALLAHEIAHLVARHPTAQLSRQLLVQAPISLSAGLPARNEWKDQLRKLGVVFGVSAPFLHYSPDQEIEASEIARRLLTEAHFESWALERAFGRITDLSRSADAPFPPFLYNHRVTNPQEDATVELNPSQSRQPGRTSPEFRAFRRTLERLAKPAAVREETPGFSAEALPNTFNHPSNYYKLSYPQDWMVTPIQPNGALITAPNGIRTSTAGDDVTQGAMLDIFQLPTSERLTLEQATNRLIVYLRQRNRTVRAVPGAQAPILINDEPGFRTVLLRGGLVRSGNSNVTEQSEVMWLVTRMYYQNLFYMVLVAPEEEFPEHQTVFEQIIRSVQFLQ